MRFGAFSTRMSSHDEWFATTAPAPFIGVPRSRSLIPMKARHRRQTTRVMVGVTGRPSPAAMRSIGRTTSVRISPMSNVTTTGTPSKLIPKSLLDRAL